MSLTALYTKAEPYRRVLTTNGTTSAFAARTDSLTLPTSAGYITVPAWKTTTCRRLSLQTIKLPGSPRVWRKCEGGYGSATRDERAGHCCGCASPAPGVWRIGHECGAVCPGYSTS